MSKDNVNNIGKRSKFYILYLSTIFWRHHILKHKTIHLSISLLMYPIQFEIIKVTGSIFYFIDTQILFFM